MSKQGMRRKGLAPRLSCDWPSPGFTANDHPELTAARALVHFAA